MAHRCPLCWHPLPRAKPKGRTLIGPAEAPSNRARSSRNGGRNHLGTPSEIKSECWATSSRIRGRLPPESAARPRVKLAALSGGSAPATAPLPFQSNFEMLCCCGCAGGYVGEGEHFPV